MVDNVILPAIPRNKNWQYNQDLIVRQRTRMAANGQDMGNEQEHLPIHSVDVAL